MRYFNLLNTFIREIGKLPKSRFVLFVTGGVTSAVAWSLLLLKKTQLERPKVISAAAAPDLSGRIRSFGLIADVVESAAPSLVCISTKRSRGTAIGSGFIVDESGYILTNAHVVRSNSHVNVTLYQGCRVRGEVLVVDKSFDLALLKINPGSYQLHALKLAAISRLRLGEFVIALGHPLRLMKSVTVGVVCSVGGKFIETDAMLKKGNSGGPLLNLYGEVVGVNTLSKIDGLGFAVLSNHCFNFVRLAMSSIHPASADNSCLRLSSGGINKCTGAMMCTFTPQMAYENRLRHPDYLVQPTTGVVIRSVVQTSPADRSGIHPGDVIESVNGITIYSIANLADTVSKSDKLDIALIRKGQRMFLKHVIT